MAGLICFATKFQACSEGWPTYTETILQPDSLKILAESCKGDSEQEKLKSLRDNISAIQVVSGAIEHQLLAGNYPRLVELYGTMGKLLYDTIEQPHQLFASVARDLYKCLWIRWGSKRRLPVCSVPLS